MNRELKLFSGNANPALARAIGTYLDLPIGAATVSSFSDGEIRVRIEENVRGADVFLIQSCCAPVNDSIMEMLIMIDALKRSSANRITAVIPYFGYARQDRKDQPRVPISAKLVNEHAAIFVGNVNAKALAQTKLAKSVLDASWTTLRTMLKYKCENAGVWYEEVNEAYTTQTCSCCGSRCSSPKGRTGLGIREWQCMECGTLHDRDVNSALNILALGHERLAVGIPVL